MSHETKGKHKEIYIGEQKKVGVNSMEFAALNKREAAGKGLGLVCLTEESQSELKLNRGAKQNKPMEKAWN